VSVLPTIDPARARNIAVEDLDLLALEQFHRSPRCLEGCPLGFAGQHPGTTNRPPNDLDAARSGSSFAACLSPSLPVAGEPQKFKSVPRSSKDVERPVVAISEK
jgi:hypothetical protein